MKHKVAEIEISYSSNKVSEEAIKSANIAVDIFREYWNENTIELYEEFKVMYLNNSNQVLGIRAFSKGSATGTVVDVNLIMAVALKTACTGMITIHNHPSGKLEASQQDKIIFEKLNKASNFFDIKIIDHIVINKTNHKTFN